MFIDATNAHLNTTRDNGNSIEVQTHAGHSIACLWPFDLILIGGQGLVMDYPCGKFGDCSFILFGFVVQYCRQTDRQTDRQTYRIIDAAKRVTPATIVGVSK